MLSHKLWFNSIKHEKQKYDAIEIFVLMSMGPKIEEAKLTFVIKTKSIENPYALIVYFFSRK